MATQEVEGQQKLLLRHARELQTAPYHCDRWLLRAHDLMKLGFPELAAGDAYKSVLLSDAALSWTSTSLSLSARLYFGMAIFIQHPYSVCSNPLNSPLMIDNKIIN